MACFYVMRGAEDSVYVLHIRFFPGVSEEGVRFQKQKKKKKRKQRENNAYIQKDVADVAGTTMDNERNTEDPA